MIPKTLYTFDKNRNFSALEILLFIVLISIVLHFGKTLFIPLSFSLIISLMLYPFCKWLERKGIQQSIALVIVLFTTILCAVALIYLLLQQIIAFSNEWESFRVKLLETINQLSVFLSEEYNIPAEKQLVILQSQINNSGAQLLSFLKELAYSFTETIFFILITPVFTGMILYHRQLLGNVFYQLFPTHKKEALHEVFTATVTAYSNFIKGMLTDYLIVGILNSAGLAIIGIPHPILFGFMASIFTIIPYIGIMVSSLLPIAVSWITFNSIWYPLGVILVFSIVQFLEAYFIFPWVVGNRLKINALMIILVVALGGILWGAAGMIIFIPYISILKLVADRMESLKTLSLLLGERNNGKN